VPSIVASAKSSMSVCASLHHAIALLNRRPTDRLGRMAFAGAPWAAPGHGTRLGETPSKEPILSPLQLVADLDPGPRVFRSAPGAAGVRGHRPGSVDTSSVVAGFDTGSVDTSAVVAGFGGGHTAGRPPRARTGMPAARK